MGILQIFLKRKTKNKVSSIIYHLSSLIMHFTSVHIKYLCNKYNLAPSRKYGQNYLITDAPIKKMIEAAELSKNDTVIEIGPGFGALTFALAERAGHVIGLEIEKKIESYWEEIKNKRYEIRDKVEIKWGNVLKGLSPISYLLSHYKVVSNIPYQITSDLIRALLELENKPEIIVLMIQKEVAERICSKPRSAGSRQAGEMSLLSVAVQYYGQPEIVGLVPAGCFWPRPKVDSAILKIEIKKLRNLEISDDNFFRVVKAGFAHKRKQLWSNISRQLGIDGKLIKQALFDLTGNEKVRAEELGVEDWKSLSTIIKKNC